MQLDLRGRVQTMTDEEGREWVSLPQLLIVVEGLARDNRSYGAAILGEALKELLSLERLPAPLPPPG